MQIMNDIKECAAEYRMSTGVSATRVYLGRPELHALAVWASHQDYGEHIDVEGEGAARLEVWGMKVYAVNDDEPHMRCCA